MKTQEGLVSATNSAGDTQTWWGATGKALHSPIPLTNLEEHGPTTRIAALTAQSQQNEKKKDKTQHKII